MLDTRRAHNELNGKEINLYSGASNMYRNIVDIRIRGTKQMENNSGRMSLLPTSFHEHWAKCFFPLFRF